MLSCDGGFLPTDIANIAFFSQSMLLRNIISSDIRKWKLFQKAKKESYTTLLKAAKTERVVRDSKRNVLKKARFRLLS